MTYLLDPLALFHETYPDNPQLVSMLTKHCTQVRDKALAILDMPENKGLAVDRDVVILGAMLHDIGIGRCDARDIHCFGEAPYITHGVQGAAILRELGRIRNIDLEPYARICERHTGAGLTAENIRAQGLPLPVMDLVPETTEEKLICLADKFFSKSDDMKEKSLERIIKSITRFGSDSTQRLAALLSFFHIVPDCPPPF